VQYGAILLLDRVRYLLFALNYMGRRGPRPLDPGTLYAFAHQLYWDFRRLAEGTYRWRFDEKEYKRILDESENIQLSDEQKSSVKQCVEEEIQAGRLKETEKEERLRNLEEDLLGATQEWRRVHAGREARKQLRVPGEPDALKSLLLATNAQQVRRISEDARNWPLSLGSVLPNYLSQHASAFVAARKDRRFPRSGRPSSQLKQLWFLSRALAGAIFEVKTRTAINLVGSKRPEQIFEESRAGKSVRRKRRRK
jgi:hypothetical protein